VWPADHKTAALLHMPELLLPGHASKISRKRTNMLSQTGDAGSLPSINLCSGMVEHAALLLPTTRVVVLLAILVLQHMLFNSCCCHWH